MNLTGSLIPIIFKLKKARRSRDINDKHESPKQKSEPDPKKSKSELSDSFHRKGRESVNIVS